jgi:hypothetical protein
MRTFLITVALSAVLGGPFLCGWLDSAPLPAPLATALPAPVATAPPERELPETRGPIPVQTLPATVVPAVTPTP